MSNCYICGCREARDSKVCHECDGICFECEQTVNGMIRSHNIRAKKKYQTFGTLAIQDWLDVLREYEHECAVCKISMSTTSLTLDHVIPLSKGGLNHKVNIQPLCKVCHRMKDANLKKDVALFRERENDILWNLCSLISKGYKRNNKARKHSTTFLTCLVWNNYPEARYSNKVVPSFLRNFRVGNAGSSKSISSFHEYADSIAVKKLEWKNGRTHLVESKAS